MVPGLRGVGFGQMIGTASVNINISPFLSVFIFDDD